ncbi:MAG TPA: HD domain-containing protein [Verrucomicrobiae bacterium]
MFQQIDTRVPSQVEEQVLTIYKRLFPYGNPGFVSHAFGWAEQCFFGQYADYAPIDALYHDFEHTLQGTLCLARLLHNRQFTGATPEISARMFELTLLAILFHDTGYLKKRGDKEGTGAKYTPIHVSRSGHFANEFLTQQGFGEEDISIVQNLISCTGVNADLKTIPFRSELEKMLGFALATADLLGQMAAPDYVDKLPVLYQEFTEATHYYNDPRSVRYRFSSAEDLMKNTPAFWEKYVFPKINGDFLQLYRFLSEPYPNGPNPYLERIEANISRIREKLAAREKT